MRPTRHSHIVLATTLAAGACASISSGASNGPVVINTTHREQPKASVAEEEIEESAKERGYANGRVGGNQRQRRKDRRRAHAAGKRNAFR